MPIIERQTTINAPAERVFRYLADFPRHGEWAAHRLRIEQTSQGPVGVGTAFASVGHMMGRDFKDQVKVTEFVPNERIAFEVEGGSGRWRNYFFLQDEGGGTRITKGAEPLQIALIFRLLSPITNALVARPTFDGDLKRIKARLEG